MAGSVGTSRVGGWVVAAIGYGIAASTCIGQLIAGAAPEEQGPGRAAAHVTRPLDPDHLYLRSGEVDTARGVWRAADLKARLPRAGHAVLQLDGPMTPERRAALGATGVELGDYLPPNAYVVRLEHAVAQRLDGLGFVRWMSPYQPDWKLDPEIGLREYAGAERVNETIAGRARVVVSVFDPERTNAAADAVRAIPGAWVGAVDASGGTFEATVRFNELVLLAVIDDVQFIEDAPENTPRSNSNDRWIVQSNAVNVTPLYDHGIHGEGQIVGVLDGALDINHCSFKDSVNNTPGPSHRKVLAYNTSLGASGHGTHVSGTIAGDAGANDDTRGVAYLARIVYNSIPDQSEAALPTNNIKQRLDLHFSQGARVHTNSWGDDGTTAYTTQCRNIDLHSYQNEDSLVLFAVTNTSALKTPENAKNCLAVGASQGSPGQDSFCSGGTGPTSDGRRKPEIFAPGCSTISSSSGTACGTVALTGTSMACPAVAGTAALVRQYYADGFYPSGAANPSDAFVPSAALIKATLLNSAVDMTGIAGYPSNQEGFGRVLADNALFFAGDARGLIAQDVRNASGLATAQVARFGVQVAGFFQPLRVTLVWTDPAASPGASFAPVNDLDLEVVAPGGETFKGNVFLGGQSVSGGAKDDRNNVEMVLITSPVPGAYVVRIRGAAVNQGLQGYAVVVSGEVAPTSVPLNLWYAGAPALVAPGAPTPLVISIDEGDESLVPGSGLLHFRMSAGAYTDVPLSPIGGGQYSAVLPAALCADLPEFYFSAAGSVTGLTQNPGAGIGAPYSTEVGVVSQVSQDDMEADTGWTVGAAGDTATTGIWTRVDPVGTAFQPEDDHTPGGTQCWVTGQHTAGQTDGFNDIDGGATTLLSPVFDLSATTSPTISYWRWFASNTSGDTWVVSISNNGGASWTTVESLVSPASGTPPGWTNVSFNPVALVPLTASMQLRFVAADISTSSLVEAALDDLLVIDQTCEDVTPPCQGDANHNGIVDFADITSVLANWGGSGPQGDANHDFAVDFADITAALANWGAACGNL